MARVLTIAALSPDHVVRNATRLGAPGSVAVDAHAFKIIDPDVKNPQTVQWERAFRVFNLLL